MGVAGAVEGASWRADGAVRRPWAPPALLKATPRARPLACAKRARVLLQSDDVAEPLRRRSSE